MEFGCSDATRVRHITKLLKSSLVTNGQVDAGGMIVRRSTKLIGVFDCGVSCLHYLLRDWDVAARDDVQIDFGLRGLLLHCTSPANVFCFIEKMCGHDKDSWRFQWNSNPRRRNSKFPALTAKLWKRLIGAPGRNRTCNHRMNLAHPPGLEPGIRA